MTQEERNIRAQAHIHHAYLLGLQLMVSSNESRETIYEWMFRLFRRQHLEKFLSSFDKLGLTDLPDAVACAKYHVMSNSVGGVPVEYMAETDKKAWVRFRYPRWMYHGPTICGVPVEVSRGFLNGWYAHNGVSLGNPRLGFVCVSEDMTGEFGLCGYFREFDRDLTDGERLQFSKGELPPRFVAEDQPALPSATWSAERLIKANRNYAMDYIRNGIVELVEVIGEEKTVTLASRAARLIGLQYLAESREMVNAADGKAVDAADYLQKMFNGLGDGVTVDASEDGHFATLSQSGLRVVKGLEQRERKLLLDCWCQLWAGALASYQVIKQVKTSFDDDEIVWEISDRM